MDDVTAIETLTRNCYRSFTGFPGAEVIDTDSLYAVISHMPIPFFSGVARTKLDASAVEATFARLRASGSPFRWWVTPSSQPRELASMLQAIGMRHAYDAPGMIADLATAPLELRLPDGVTVRRLANIDEFEDWLEVWVQVFTQHAERGAVLRDAYARCGYGDDAAWQHFVAYDDDQPVATTSVLLDGTLGGIYHVGTVPAARGRGIGAEITRAGMRYLRDRGATRAGLQSSESGYGVYRSLGFEHRCDVSCYEWLKP